MHFNDYQILTAEFAVYPEAFTGSKAELSYLGLGIGDEAGEVLGKTKKYLRGDGAFDRVAVAKELGDILWYIARYAAAIGVELDTVACMNLAKLTDRKERDVLKGSGDDR